VEGFTDPERITRKDNKKEGFIPDIVSEKEGSKDLYEVELNDKDYILDKWRLFSRYAIKSQGSFNIVVPEQNLDLIKNLLKENSISARILYFT
jgi:hypothetical protein